MSVHCIRLAGPWEFAWLDTLEVPSGAAVPGRGPDKSGSVKMPCDWRSLFGNAAGRATFSRRFHRPTNLDTHEQVVIVLTGVGGAGSVTLNDELLLEFAAAAGPIEVNVTNRLLAFNRLDISVDFSPSRGDSSRGGLYAPVVLEIRTP